MKQYFIYLFLFSLIYNVGLGQGCVGIDLTKQKQDLEKVIADMDDKVSDKIKLQQLSVLFKSCVNNEELKNIRNTYLSLAFDAPQQQTYKTIIKNILDENKLLCVNFRNNTQQGINKDYIFDLDALLKEYEKIREDKIKNNTYSGSSTEKNYIALQEIKILLSDCVDGVTLKKIQDLKNLIDTKNFGSLTTIFKANLNDIINLNSDLLTSKNTATTIVEDTTESPVVKKIDEVEPEKSSLVRYLLYTLLLLSILANGYFLYEKFFKKQKEETPLKAISSRPKTDLTTFEKTELEGLRKKEKEFIKKSQQLEKELEEAKNTIKELEKYLKQVDEIVLPTVNLSKQSNKYDNKKNKPSNHNSYERILFFASPTLQGEFLAKHGQSEMKVGASVYKFYITGSDATFEFYNHPSTFHSALNDEHNRIKPVCEKQNLYNPNATNIKTTKDGIAVLEGDKWVVKQKAEIRYEA